jgi:hypothetical protein
LFSYTDRVSGSSGMLRGSVFLVIKSRELRLSVVNKMGKEVMGRFAV